MNSIHVRTMTQDDRSEVADLIYASVNTWYRLHGMSQIFNGGPSVAGVFLKYTTRSSRAARWLPKTCKQSG